MLCAQYLAQLHAVFEGIEMLFEIIGKAYLSEGRPKGPAGQTGIIKFGSYFFCFI